ncbi:chromosome segregation protein SMC [Fulvivirga lutimaris]|uniref:chromosome segregation protein SMC n=1 Tax=Fulvivirga lutimaris TaxID=1819566 RepID=UPI0012BC86B8|nr:chromosome segregation protein SMC [Fulvivirga lutimaris]MTI38172.1 chromosome segregation protein SMC [Fulvivirga lutimaris]
MAEQTQENQNQKSPSQTPPKKSNRNTVIVVILAVIVVAQAIKIYIDHQESVAKDTQLMSTEEDLAVTMQKLTDISEELDQKIIEIEKLGGNVEELEKAKAEVEAELNRTRKRDRKAISDLQDKVDGFQELLKAKDEELTKLREVNKVLLTENTSLKTEKNELFDSLSMVNESKDELASKVAIASQLKVENILILAVNERGREREMPAKSKQIDKLKVTFNIAENNVAPIEGKDILIRIVDDKGQVIFDIAKGSGTFMFNNKEEFYTANQEILFDNTKQQLSFEYTKGSEYEPGVYLLEVYTDGYKMGSQQFEVK